MLLILQDPAPNLQAAFDRVWEQTVINRPADLDPLVRTYSEQLHKAGALYAAAILGQCQTIDQMRREVDKLIAQVFTVIDATTKAMEQQ